MERYLTKQRLLFLLAAFILFAAWNRGLNLLYGMFALLIATTLLAHLFPRLMLRGISVNRNYPKSIIEGESLPLEVTLVNRSVFARRMIEIVDRVPPAAEDERRPMLFIAKLAGRERRDYRYELRCEQRGEHNLGPLTVRSGFPLGIVTRERVLPDTVSSLLVYPSMFPIVSLPLAASGNLPLRGVAAVSRAGSSEDFSGTREYRRGDSPRFIHWPSTARHGEMIVKEFEMRAATEVTIVLDLNKHAQIGSGKESTLEYAVKIAASITRYALAQGHDVQLVACGTKFWFVPAGRGVAQLARILEVLARVQADGDTHYSWAVERAVETMREGAAAVLIFSDYERDIFGQLRAIASLRARRIKPLCIFLNRRSFGAMQAVGDKKGAMGAAQLHRRFDAEGVPSYLVNMGDSLERIFSR